MTENQIRIKNGIKFFKQYAGETYDSSVVRKYFPTFLKLVEEELFGEEDLVKVAEDIFQTKAI